MIDKESSNKCLKLGNNELKNENYDLALNHFYDAIAYNPDNYYAFWGIFLCKKSIAAHYGYEDKYSNPSKFKDVTDYLRYAYTAINIAKRYDSKLTEEYRKLIEEDENYILNTTIPITKKENTLHKLLNKINIFKK